MRRSSAPLLLVLVLLQTYYESLALSQGASSWALRVNNSCLSGDSDCGPTIDYFHACCPPTSPCQSQYNSVCCPDQAINCTGTLVASGPRCADPTYNLCDNGGYFCCLPQQFCYSNGDTDGCADAGYELRPGQSFLPTIHQVQPSTTFAAQPTSESSAASQMTAASTKAPAISSPSSSLSSLSSSSSTSSGSSSTSSPSRGLSTSDKIELGVPIAIGVPGLVVSFYLAWIKWRSRKHKSEPQ